MLRARNKENEIVQTVQITNRKKMNSKHYDRADADPFMYTKREGLSTAKREKKRGKANATMYLCSP